VWPLPFTKLHGLGNAYLFVDARDSTRPDAVWPEVARRVSDAGFGVGSDGLILILTGRAAPFRMRIFNRDGSEAEMCGNGIRGFAKYLFDRGLAGRELTVETGAGLIRTEVSRVDAANRARTVTVDMGPPRIRRREIPMAEGNPDEPALDVALPLASGPLTVSAVSMGNPHAIHFTDRLWSPDETAAIGQAVEHHPWFPKRVNFHVAVVESPRRVRVRHWERGSGLTLSCGTGASALVAAGVLTGRLDRTVDVEVPGGELTIEWRDDDHLWMTGPAEEVLEGVFWPR
jgi:diaminopimelate epimerase